MSRFASITVALSFSAACADPPDPELRVGTQCPAVVMAEVNDRWIADHPEPGNNQWERATYFTGNMAAYQTLGDDAYLDYAMAWVEQHDWKLNGGTDTRNADNHTAGQTHLALYRISPDPARIAAIATSIDNVVDRNGRGDWSWIDAQFMASPVFAELGEISGDDRYVDAMFELFDDARTRRRLYDPEIGLWYRDEGYRYPDFATKSGARSFWSRGNGWVIASLVRTLEHLPPDNRHHDDYVAMLQAMAAALAQVQRADGFWNASLHDPVDHGGREASGTSFFVYALAWGIDQGYLDRDIYLPVVDKAWRGLVELAIHEDGGVGWVQGVGEAPASAQPVTLGDTEDYGVGAFLLAASTVHVLDLELGCDPRASTVDIDEDLQVRAP